MRIIPDRFYITLIIGNIYTSNCLVNRIVQRRPRVGLSDFPGNIHTIHLSHFNYLLGYLVSNINTS